MAGSLGPAMDVMARPSDPAKEVIAQGANWKKTNFYYYINMYNLIWDISDWV